MAQINLFMRSVGKPCKWIQNINESNTPLYDLTCTSVKKQSYKYLNFLIAYELNYVFNP